MAAHERYGLDAVFDAFASIVVIHASHDGSAG
jgi:hypothetical protein